MELHNQYIPCQGISLKQEMHPAGVLAMRALLGHYRPMVPNNISSLRRARKLSQTELATAIGTTLSQLGKLERGERPLTIAWIERLSEALEVEPFHLIAPERLFPTEDQLTDMLLLAQQQLPTGLPYSEWPRAVASGLHTRLLMLADDRANADNGDV